MAKSTWRKTPTTRKLLTQRSGRVTSCQADQMQRKLMQEINKLLPQPDTTTHQTPNLHAKLCELLRFVFNPMRRSAVARRCGRERGSSKPRPKQPRWMVTRCVQRVDSDLKRLRKVSCEERPWRTTRKKPNFAAWNPTEVSPLTPGLACS